MYNQDETLGQTVCRMQAHHHTSYEPAHFQSLIVNMCQAMTDGCLNGGGGRGGGVFTYIWGAGAHTGMALSLTTSPLGGLASQ